MSRFLRLSIDAILSLRAAGQRTLLALLGIIIGTGSVIAMLNIGHIAEETALAEFQTIGSHLIAIRGASESGEEEPRLTEAHAIQALKAFGFSPKQFATVVTSGAAIQSRGRYIESGSLMALPSTFSELSGIRVQAGRLVGEYDQQSLVATIGHRLAQQLKDSHGRPVQVGDTIRAGNKTVHIVGILAAQEINSFLNVDYNETLFLPPETLKRLVSHPRLSYVLLSPPTDVDQPVLKQQLIRWFDHQPRPVAVEIQSALDAIREFQEQMRIMTAMLGAIGAIAMLVGGIGVMNIMLVAVAERRKEIGLRLAIGATPSDIRNQFLLESIFLTILGGLLGTALGVAVSYLFASAAEMTFAISTFALVAGPAISAGFGVFFGSFPASRAAQLPPIEALRS